MLNDSVAVEIKDGKIFIDGQDQGLERDDQEHMRLTVRGLRKAHTVQMLEERLLEDRRLFGTGTVEGSLGLVGQTYTVSTVEVIIQAAPDEKPDLNWHTLISASFANGEFDEEDRWAIHLCVPGDVWKRLEFDYNSDQACEIDLVVVAPLWCKRTPFFHQRRPELKMPPYRTGSGGATHGKTSSITWRDRPVVLVGKSTPAGDFKDSESEPIGPIAALLAGYQKSALIATWSLPAIAILLAFIAAR